MSEYRSRRSADNYESTNPGPGCREGAVACRTGNLHLIGGKAGRTMREAAKRAKGRTMRSGWLLLAAGWSLLAAPGLPLGAAAAYGAADEVTAYHPQNGLDPGYVDLYNLDFAGAHKQFSAWMQAHPEDPLGSASDAAAYLFGEFDRLSIIDVELFADQSRFDSRSKLTPDPAVRQAFEDRRAGRRETVPRTSPPPPPAGLGGLCQVGFRRAATGAPLPG